MWLDIIIAYIKFRIISMARQSRYTTDSFHSDSAARIFPEPRKAVGSTERLPYNPNARIQSRQPDFLKHFSLKDYA
jgi:hypothetical protein